MNTEKSNNSSRRKKEPTVESLIQALNDKDRDVRMKAAQALGNIGDPRAVEPLIQALGYDDFGDWDEREKDNDFQIKAVEALGKIGDARAIKPLMEAIKLEDWEVRGEISKTFAKIGEPAIKPLIDEIFYGDFRGLALYVLEKMGELAVGPLLEALEDLWITYFGEEGLELAEEIILTLGEIGEPAVIPLIQILKTDYWQARMYAAEALEKTGDERAIEPLVQALRDDEADEPIEDVRAKAAEGLDKLDWEPRNDKEKAHYLIAKNQWDELVKLGEIGIKELIQDLKFRDACITEHIFLTLIKIGEPAVKPLIKALKEDDTQIRELAASALTEIGEPAVIPLIKALKEENLSIRFNVAVILGDIGDERAVEPLIKALEDKNSEVRSMAAFALGDIGDSKAIEPLIQALKDEDWNVRWGATEALGKIGNSRAAEVLSKALNDKNQNVRRAAIYALKNIKEKKT